MFTALVLIDIQNDYFPGGKMKLEGSDAACLHARDILAIFRERGMLVVHVRHISSRPGATFFLPGTHGSEIHSNVRPLPAEMVIQKHYPNSFRETPLLEHLRENKVGEVVFVGMMTHMCVDATVRAAFDYSFRCTVVHDACATQDLTFQGKTVSAREVHWAFLSALGAVYARVISARDFLDCFRTRPS
jgi:nicotinamidase-related amidase